MNATTYLVNGTRIPDDVVRSLLARPADETRPSGCEFRALPPELCRLTDPDDIARSCCCSICRPPIGPQAPSYWDTLASAVEGRQLRVWTVHYPTLGEAQHDAR